MNLLEFIDKGGIIVYILIFLNIIGFTIIIWKFTTLPQVNKTIAKIASRLDFNHSINAQIEYEVKKLESGLVIIKNIAIKFIKNLDTLAYAPNLLDSDKPSSST